MVAVYRCYSTDGTLLYVGVSGDALRRFSEHGETKAWFPEVASIALEHYPTREAAKAREKGLIHALTPRYNVHDNLPARAEPYQPLVLSRGKRQTSRSAQRTHCLHGHPYDSVNTYISPQGYRSCRECRRRVQGASRRKLPGAA